MILTHISSPAGQASAISTRIRSDLTAAFQTLTTINGQFIVNDSKWYAENDRGKVTPCVMNSAQFISARFLTALETSGWTQPKTLNNQEIDAYVEVPVPPTPVYRILDANFPIFFGSYIASAHGLACLAAGEPLDVIFSRLYQSLGRRASALQPDAFEPALLSHFQSTGTSTCVRLGLEFETGNIASSFRAINKLAVLFSQNLIDAGVFITSIDKANCACRIWPVSNRNGSFEELTRRNYKSEVTFPLWEIGFKPDGFSAQAPYLTPSGNIYSPVAKGTSRTITGVSYGEWTGDRNKTVLKRI